MPSVVHAPLMNTPSFMLKEKSGEPLVSAFTAVNGRTSPPSPRTLNGLNGMTSDTIQVRSFSRNSPGQNQDQKAPFPGRDDQNPAPRLSENGLPTVHSSVSPSLSGSASPNSPGKRKRSSSVEDAHSYPSPDGTEPSRRRLDSYVSVGRDDSPNTVSQAHPYSMEHSQQRSLPPMDRAEHERNWPPRDSQDGTQNGYSDPQHRDPRSVEAPQDPNSSTHPQGGAVGPDNGVERSSTTEITRAGVQVDPKKRKRQFANRTKTGCGTCRRRKKKCDEAKPECNNCQRGGFICEGYANKIPWPKNNVSKPHPPLQAKDRYPVDPAQLYHNHGGNREAYSDSNAPGSGDGARSRPIVVEEHDRPQARNGWGSWNEPPRASYPPEHHQPSEYPHPPQSSSHGRPSSNDHHAPHPTQGPPQRQHNPRIYHHTPQTMSQVVNNPPAVTAEAVLHHQSQQAHPPHQQPPMHQAPPTAAPPGPPPSHYVPPPPPRPQKTEKDKMLGGEPFMPYHPQLLEERERCKGAIYRFNNTSNSAVDIVRDERDRHFRSILAAKWTQQYRSPEPPRSGHLGREVYVDTPFMCDYGYNISIADGVDIGTHCKFLDSGRIAIGRNTSIGANVTIDTQRVPTDSKSMKGTKRTAVAADVYIGENVFIGANSIICAGVKIGTGAIIHAGSVVVRDVPRDVVVRGNPAEVRVVHWED